MTVGKALAQHLLSQRKKHERRACLQVLLPVNDQYSAKWGAWLTFLSFSLFLSQGRPWPLAPRSLLTPDQPERTGSPQPVVLPSVISLTCSQLRSEYIPWKIPEINN